MLSTSNRSKFYESILTFSLPRPSHAYEQVAQTPPALTGNWTYNPNLLLPTRVEKGQIPIGANWTHILALQKELKYHIYYFGNWIDEVETNRTDYDIIAKYPNGSVESSHTEAAGLPEHLGSTVEDPLYVPKQTGNYSYLILNDPKDSGGARNVTFMAIEHLDTNRWCRNKLYLQGRELTGSKTPTAWAYEFSTNSSRIEISVAVPDTLDMYEARLYLMSNPTRGKGSYLSGMPIAWELGLYGRTYYDTTYKHTIGGYNLNTTGYRGNALASSEFAGQDMLINYTSPYKGLLLYHLVFIAEYGKGNLNFIMKTDFNKPVFKVQYPWSSVVAGQDVAVQALVNESRVAIDYLTLEYRLDDNQTWTTVPMTLNAPRTYVGAIPSQPEGTAVTYKVTAYDVAGNKASQQLSYRTYGQSSLSVSPSAISIDGGQNITLSGQLNPGLQKAILSVNYTGPQGMKVTRMAETNSTGGFRDVFKPEMAGDWSVNVGWKGNERYSPTLKIVNFTVLKAPVSVTLDIDKRECTLGDNVRVFGAISAAIRNVTLKIVFTDSSGRKMTVQALTGRDGSFNASYTPTSSGQFSVQVIYDGDRLREAFSGQAISLKVNPEPSPSFFEKYLLYFLVGGGAFGALMFFRWFRGRKKKMERRVLRPSIIPGRKMASAETNLPKPKKLL